MNASEFNLTESDPGDVGELPAATEMISNATLDMFVKVAYRGVIPTMAVVGLICNVFSFVLLCPMKERSTTNIYLIGLTVCDVWSLLHALAYCATSVLEPMSNPAVTQTRNLMIPIFMTYISPLPNSISNCLVTVIALERFVAVVFPLKVKIICDKRFAIVSVLACYVIPSIVSFPLALMYEHKEDIDNETGAVVDVVMLTPFGRDRDAVNAVYLTSEVVLRFTPVLLVAIASSITIISLFNKSRKSKLRKHRLQPRPKEVQITITLLTLTTVFLLTNVPSTIGRCIRFLRTDLSDTWSRDNLQWLLMVCWYIFYVINSCVNFPIYIITCQEYRQQFQKIMCRKLPNKSGKYILQRKPGSISFITRC